jgi:hypothetical protein
MATINVEIEVSDIMYDLSDKEKQKLFNELIEEGFTLNAVELYNSEDIFDIALLKLYRNGWKLSLEDYQILLNISEKII